MNNLKEKIREDILRVNDEDDIDFDIEDKIDQVMEVLEKNGSGKSILFIPSEEDEENEHMVLFNRETEVTTPFREYPEWLVRYCMEQGITIIDFTEAETDLAEIDRISLSSDNLIDYLEEKSGAEIFNYAELSS